MSENTNSSPQIRFRDIALALEVICWVVVLLCPLLRLVNGPAVTNDQFVFQVTLFCTALIAATSLRIHQLVANRRCKR
jgi:hypothetical protein